jgi:hypothetical protein
MVVSSENRWLRWMGWMVGLNVRLEGALKPARGSPGSAPPLASPNSMRTVQVLVRIDGELPRGSVAVHQSQRGPLLVLVETL